MRPSPSRPEPTPRAPIVRILAALPLLAALTILGGCGRGGTRPASPALPSPSLSPRPGAALAALTLDEKIALVTGTTQAADDPLRPAGHIAAIQREGLDVPPLYLGDGPNGVGDLNTGVTQFPAAIALAATWDVDLARAYGGALGAEWAGKGINVGLGPAMNIVRLPYGGRGAEYLGEDPWLAGQIAAGEVQGIQGENVVATIKHFAANNQETDKFGLNVVVSERALRELYLPAFETAVQQGGAMAIMGAYNRVNGTYACEDPHLLKDILRGDWGFQGWVMSDWGATHDTVRSAMAGLDQEMPGTALEPLIASFFGPALREAVVSGAVPGSALDGMARNILTGMDAVGLFDHRNPTPSAVVSTEAHRALARRIAGEGTALLKNAGGVLPLSRTSKLMITGPGADDPGGSAIGGSGVVAPSGPVVTPLEAIMGMIGEDQLTYAPAPASAVAAAQGADTAIIFLKDVEGELFDHPAYLPADQNELVASVAKAAKRTIVVLSTGSALILPWAPQVDAILASWYGGEELGPALADLLFGVTAPSGKSPLTFAASEAQWYGQTPGTFPGVPTPGDEHLTVTYTEGIFVGYRWFDETGQDPLFPFGHGLTYTTFEYGDLAVEPVSGDGASVTVSATVRNTGSRPGREVAQLYLEFPAAAGEPPRQLKGFRKLVLAPGEAAEVTFYLDARSFSHWDDPGWTVAPGAYQVMVGSSSRDLRLQGSFTVLQTGLGLNAAAHPEPNRGLGRSTAP